MFVPLFVQGVLGGSATSSGLVLTPLMLAMMATSVGSGHHHAHRPLPLGAVASARPIVMGAGFVLSCRRSTPARSQAATTLAMIVAGLGLGLLIRTSRSCVQNVAAEPAQPGAATSAAQSLARACRRPGRLGVSVHAGRDPRRAPDARQASPRSRGPSRLGATAALDSPRGARRHGATRPARRGRRDGRAGGVGRRRRPVGDLRRPRGARRGRSTPCS